MRHLAFPERHIPERPSLTRGGRPRRFRPVAWLPLLLLCLASVAPGSPVLASEPPRVCAVEVRLDGSLGRPLELESLVTIQPGVALTEGAVRRTLSNFQASGLIDESEVRTTPCQAPVQFLSGESVDDPSPGRWVTAIVVLRARPWVESVAVTGEMALRRSQVERAITQPSPAPLSEERLLESHYALQDLYRERGYRRARVRLEVDAVAARHRIRFHLEPGERYRVGRVEFSGELATVDRESLEAVVRSRPNGVYSRARVLADADRLRERLIRLGYYEARVEPAIETEDPETRRIHLAFPIVLGAPVDVSVLGARRSRLEKLGLLRFLRDPNLDTTLIEQSCARIESHYQRRGRFLAHVDCRESMTEGRRQLEIEVAPGEKTALEAIRFEGNERISDTVLTSLIGTSVARRLRPGSGRLVEVDLEEDLDNLRSYYLLQGFHDAEVGPAQIHIGGSKLTLVVPIHEGVQRRLVRLSWSGNTKLGDDEIADSLPMTSGGPYHPVLLEESVNILRTLYEDLGHRDVAIEPRLDWNRDQTRVDVDLVIDEGERITVDRVVLRGLQHTRPKVVRRALRLEKGETLSRRRLLEAERDLYRLGIFSRVDVEQAPSSGLGPARDVVVRLEEGLRWRLGYGLSYHSDDGLGGLFSLSRSNLGGRGDRLQFDARGNQADRRFRLILDQPSLFKTNLPITFILFRQEEERPEYQVDDTGGQISLAKELGRARWGLLYDYRRVELEIDTVDFADLGLEDIDREDREVEISSLTPNLFVDRRDDPLAATRGWSSQVQLEWAFPFLDAEANFLKLFWQQTWYRPLGRFGGLAASFRFGAIEPLDEDLPPDPLVPPTLASATIPISERFFAGGRTSHRAYERDQLGIRDQTLLPLEDGGTVEVGGNGLFVLNLDYRFPISGEFGGTVFFDLGNVWADWRDFDGDDLRPGLGIGLRYGTPIGPVRFEMGWKVDRQPGEEIGPVLFLSFGNPF